MASERDVQIQIPMKVILFGNGVFASKTDDAYYCKTEKITRQTEKST